mmetsp:Transcript_57672/g.100970  ORF Transcript_57672/g.100970 Transcript_57672/m.100970 type:complete len:384 (-) Transcript_57672:198-1349(-)
MPLKLHAMLLGRQPPAGNHASQRGAPRRSWTGTSLGSSSSGNASSVERRFIVPPSGTSSTPQKQVSGPLPGKPPSGPPAGWSARGARAAPLRSTSKLRPPPDSPPSPLEAEAFHGSSGDPDLDALDGLLRQASASLKKINKIREQLPSQPPLPKRRVDTDSFWKPRCRSDLWNDDEDCWDFDDSDVDSEFGSQGSSVGIDLEEEALWEFLRTACGADLSGMRSGAAGGATRAAAAAAAAAHGRGSEATSGTGHSRPKEPPSPGMAGRKPYEPRVDGTATRGDRGGFRFGTYADKASHTARPPLPGGVAEVHSTSPTPEVKVSATLAAAKAQGPDAVRRAIKELLLKWHPDKAPQGDSPEAVAARAESTRVLRHVLQERKRLGL